LRSLYGRRPARKDAGIFVVRKSRRTARRGGAQQRGVITALISFNWQLGLQLRILNGVVSLLTTVRKQALAAYMNEQSGASGNLQMTTAEIDRLIDADKRGGSSNFGISSLWRNSAAPTAGCASPHLKHFYSVSGSQRFQELTTTSLSDNPPTFGCCRAIRAVIAKEL
jgi:hypothetical protein